MIMIGVWGGMSSHARTSLKHSTVLFVTLCVPYAAGRGCTCERIDMMGRCIHFLDGLELLIAMMVTLVPVYAFVRW